MPAKGIEVRTFYLQSGRANHDATESEVSAVTLRLAIWVIFSADHILKYVS